MPDNQSLDEELEKRKADILRIKELCLQSESPELQSTDNSTVASAVTAAGESREFIESVHSLLSQAASRLVMLQLEDLCGYVEMVNMPGTIDEHPNWRRRMIDDVDDLAELLGKSGALQKVIKHRKAA